jgi:hypothetical protein
VQSEHIGVIPRKDLVAPQRGCPNTVDPQRDAQKNDEDKREGLERGLVPNGGASDAWLVKGDRLGTGWVTFGHLLETLP